jgi:ElaB/YqjD/DUF883 family membrane-anchored ribosome-binding protein
MVLNQVSGLIYMGATRFAVQIVSALMCAIFLLSFAGCPFDSNLDKIKEDAYKQGYEQGLKDNSKTPITAPSWIPEREKVTPSPYTYTPGYLPRTQNQQSEAERDYWQLQQEQDQQQLEDEIEQLKMEADSARREAESAKIEAETRLYFERKKAEEAQYDMEHQEYLRTHPWAKKPWE